LTTFYIRNAFTLVASFIMKRFTPSNDRIIIVKKIEGRITVTVKQKDSDTKFAELTPNRYAV